MAKRGRKSDITKWSEPKQLLTIRHWRMHGLTIQQVADNINISAKTLYQWASRNSDIREALKSGHEQAVAVVENKLYLKALAGNMTAIIFFLKNMDRQEYNDSQLSPEERELMLARVRKANAEAKIAEMRAKQIQLINEDGDQSIIVDDISEVKSDGDSDKEKDNSQTK